MPLYYGDRAALRRRDPAAKEAEAQNKTPEEVRRVDESKLTLLLKKTLKETEYPDVEV